MTLTPETSSKLLELLKTPDAPAWSEFFQRYWELLVRWARGAGLSPADADEVAQQTLISIARRMPTFEYDRTKGRFHHYLRRAINTKIIDFFKQKQRHPPHVSLMEHDQAIAADKADGTWDDEFRRDTIKRWLDQIRPEVGDDHVLIFVDYFLEEQPAKKIAAKIGIPSAHVANRAWTVMRRLRELAAAEQADFWEGR